MDKDTWPGMDKNTYHREGYLYQNRYKYYPALSARRQGQRHIRREPLILHGSRRNSPSQAGIFSDGSFKDLNGRGRYPSYAMGELDNMWLSGVNANNAIGWNERGGTQEILFNNVGGNTLHGEVTWKLSVQQNPAFIERTNILKTRRTT